MCVWRYQLSENYCYQHTAFKGITFANDWVNIKNGLLTVKSGYAWDGCSPKLYIFGLFTLGTPDGALRFGKPWLYHASLVHDVLCQFRQNIPLAKQQVIQIFKDQLIASKWPLHQLYIWAVNILGPQDFLIK